MQVGTYLGSSLGRTRWPRDTFMMFARRTKLFWTTRPHLQNLS
jgi:hypothetical protein